MPYKDIEKRRENARKYRKLDYVKAKEIAYFSRPDIKEKLKKYQEEYRTTPQRKESNMRYRKSEKWKERNRAWTREYRKRPEVAEKRRKYNLVYLKTPRVKMLHRVNHLKKYGMNIQEYDKLFKNQNGRCAICRKEQISRNLTVDHDHNNGKVRGLLCNLCNAALGGFKDSILVLQEAIRYLEKCNGNK